MRQGTARWRWTILLALGGSAALAAAETGPAIPPAASAAVTPDVVAADVRELIGLTGAGEVIARMRRELAALYVAALREGNSDLDPRATAVATKAVDDFLTKRADADLFGDIVAAYRRHFTAEEIHALAAFYTSPLGRKAIDGIPAVNKETTDAVQAWAQRTAPELREEILARLKEAEIPLD